MRFNLRKTDKAGGNIYAAEGVRASVYVNKSIFKDGKAPQSLEISIGEGNDGVAFSEPGAVRPVVSSEEAIAKAKAAAEKAQVAAEKARVRAEKAAARAAKMVPAQEAVTA